MAHAVGFFPMNEKELVCINFKGESFVTTKQGKKNLHNLIREFNELNRLSQEPIITNDQIIDQGKKVKFKVPTDFLDHTEYIEYETTEAGLEHFKHLQDPNKDQREFELAEAMEDLTFIDGVLLARSIFTKIINNAFEDDLKDEHGFSYKSHIFEKMDDILDNNVFNQAQKHRSEDLHDLFEIRNSQYTT